MKKLTIIILLLLFSLIIYSDISNLERAVEYEKMEDYKKSEKYFKLAADKDESPAAMLKMSIILETQGKKSEAKEYFEKGMVVFFAGGTGQPYFSTDTGVVLRAIEVEADVILLAKAIDGVYDDDPAKNPAAKKYDEVSIHEVIEKNLQVVDMTASILARDNKMPMWVFGLNEKDSIVNTVKGNFTGTKVTV